MIPSVYLLDIEGTTTSISFVYDVLFPYAAAAAPAYIAEHWDRLAEVRSLYWSQILTDRAAGLVLLPGVTETLFEISHMQELTASFMAADRKLTCLKQLQGELWRTGYINGQLQGHVYADVPLAFERWTSTGARVAIYSSGSVAAQKLLFGHSIHGDLRPYLSGYFDTRIGAKTDRQSYARIAQELDRPPAEIVFATDKLSEAEAASSAGLQSILLKRPGNAPNVPNAFRSIDDFNAL